MNNADRRLCESALECLGDLVMFAVGNNSYKGKLTDPTFADWVDILEGEVDELRKACLEEDWGNASLEAADVVVPALAIVMKIQEMRRRRYAGIIQCKD